jgi:proteasome accessory factor B
MAEQITKLQRWLDLIALLVGRRLPVTVEEIMERVPAYAARWVEGDETKRATARRTFERDKDELRALGIPIETVTYRINYGAEEVEGYRITRRDFYLPYLELVRESRATPSDTGSASGRSVRPYDLEALELPEDEAAAALDALRRVADLPAFPYAAEARSALRKLTFDLVPEIGGDRPVFYIERPDAGRVLERLRPLSDALLARKRVGFRYHGIIRGETTDREVQPYGLFFQRGQWYLVAHDLGREEVRVFRVGRMEDVRPNRRAPNTPDYEVPADFRLQDYARRNAWELGEEEPVRAKVLFRFPLSLWAARNRHGELVESRTDGGEVRAFEVQQVDPFLRWILGFGGEAVILEPPELARELERMARDVVALYGEVAG